MSAGEVIAHERDNDYYLMDIFEHDDQLRHVLLSLVNGSFYPSDPEHFRPLYDSLLNTNVSSKPDPYFNLVDFRAYVGAQERVETAYRDRDRWNRSAILNVARSGKFSSDRTIMEYINDIWHLEKIK